LKGTEVQEKTNYRLALDLGSTSLGWAVFRLNDAKEPTAIIRAGVRIFSDGRHPKDGSSLAVVRRQARAMRRRRDRLLQRKTQMLHRLVKFGFFPDDEKERKLLERLNPYELRAKGLDEVLTPAEFGRALFHLNQRRGFQSNRKTDRNADDSGALKQAISGLRSQMQATGMRTVGEWLWKQRMQEDVGGIKGKGVRARYREEKIQTETGKNRIDKSYDLYIDRVMVAQEFDALWRVQTQKNPSLFSQDAYEALRHTLLFQRPLKPIKSGRCTFFPDQERALLALPSMQRFRIYQEVNNLRILQDGLSEQALTLEQRNAVVDLLEHSGKVTFKTIVKTLGLPSNTQFNLEDAKRSELKGNATSAVLGKKNLLGAKWWALSEAMQEAVVLQLLTQESEDELLVWLQSELGMDEATAQQLANAKLPEGYGRLSRQAIDVILPQLYQAVVTYDKAVLAAGLGSHSDLGFDFPFTADEVVTLGERIHPSTGEITQRFAFKQLPYYGRVLQRFVSFGSGNPQDPEEKRFGKIANPTVHIGLNQVRVVVNALIRRYGLPQEVVIELARNLKQSSEQKQEAQREQADNQKRNERIRQAIAEVLDIAPDRVRTMDIQKWRLWEELNPQDALARLCPYSGVRINTQMLLSDEVEIEHILPFSQTLDDSMNNRTVSMRRANRVKGNRTPWQAREDFAVQGWAYTDIQARVQSMPARKRYRFAADGLQRWQGEDQGFLARALNDTRYLSLISVQYLRLVCPGTATRAIPGQMTALLRERFGLNSVLGLDGIKNRNDHRHHAVDACVIGVTDQGLLQRISQVSAQAREQGLSRLLQNMPLPWPTYRDHVQRAVQHIWVSHRPDHSYEAGLMEDTAYGIAKDGTIKQRRQADGSEGRIVSNVIRISAPQQAQRHGTDAAGQPLPYKGYIGGSNYCIEITADDKGKWQGHIVSTFDAYQIVRKHGVKQLRHPHRSQTGQPLVMRLNKGDVLRILHEECWMTLRIGQMKTAGTLMLVPIQEANFDARARAKEVSYVSKTAGSLQKAQAQAVRISPIGDLKVIPTS